MNIEATKLELMNLLLKTEKKSVLNKLKKVFEEEHTDWFDEMSQEEQQEVKKGLEQANESELIDNETIMNHFEKWH